MDDLLEIEGKIFYFSRDHHGNSSKDDLLFFVGEGVPNGFNLPKYGMEKSWKIDWLLLYDCNSLTSFLFERWILQENEI